uniref:Small ribosomal subunit protein uS14m n=1 Tax=Andalucia godoyi TaxID=505711 RepID=M4QCR0_ANDGO|nr:ribosomal protein S14 [Andalucia godoyi]AGH23985.1 ribosomal protein S14 [Andalucia godoyi]
MSHNKMIKDQKIRQLVDHYEVKRAELKSIFYNQALPMTVREEAFAKLSKLPRNSSIVRIRNRCVLTGRGRGISQDFKVSRITLRELVSKGMIPGLKKSSW